jgi:hypothetical protein
MCSASLVGTLAVLALFAWLPSLSQGPVTAQAAALANGGFEETYQPWQGSVDRMIAPGWSLWYTTNWPDEKSIDSPRANEVSSPIHGGNKAQEVHGNGTKNFDACLFQQIGGITVGHYVRFSAWAFVDTQMDFWDMQTRVGIDPNGGTNPKDIQYETHPGYWASYTTKREWQKMSVVMLATSPTVTVYACAHPKYAMSFHVYWDDAAFSVVPEQRVHLPIVEREHCVVAPGTLYNPDLEKDYCTLHGYQIWPVPSVKVEVAPFWQPFCNYVPNSLTHKWPEFGYTDRSYRVHSGAVAQQYGTSGGGAFEAGIYQVITGTLVGDALRFTIWGLGWTQEWDENDPDGYNEFLSDHQEPGGLSFRVGIDPWGGQSSASSNIIWSPTYDPYDAWHQFEVSATAMYTRVSVWAYAHPTIATMRWNQTFWDNANLEVISMP